jgi:integrase
MSKRKKSWSWSTGDRGSTVRVFENYPGSMLYIAVWDPTLGDGRGGYARRSLEHRNKRRAKQEARQAVARLEAGQLTHRVTLGYLIDLYLHHELEGKAPGTVKWLRQHLGTWVTYLGRQFPVTDFGTGEWEAFKRQRLSGAINGHGVAVEPERRRPVRPGTVNLALDALNIVFNWAYRWRVDGRPLLRRNPAWKLPYLDDPNIRRSVWTWDRFQKIVAAVEQLTMQVEWDGRRRRVRCYLADILVIAEGTARRIGPVRQLRYQDLRLEHPPHGAIAWPAETDKKGKEWRTPISPVVRARLLKVIRERPGLGAAPLFPAPRDVKEPVGRDTLASWQRKAEKAAGVPRLPHDSFHGLRRKFVVERKHLPDVDVAAAGGWRSVTTMKRTYQLADEAGVLEAVMEPKRLREREA